MNLSLHKIMSIGLLPDKRKLEALKAAFLTAISEMDSSTYRDYTVIIPFEAQNMVDFEELKAQHPTGVIRLKGIVEFFIKRNMKYLEQNETEARNDPKNYVFELPLLDLLQIKAEDIKKFLKWKAVGKFQNPILKKYPLNYPLKNLQIIQRI